MGDSTLRFSFDQHDSAPASAATVRFCRGFGGFNPQWLSGALVGVVSLKIAQHSRRGPPIGVRGSSAEWDSCGFELCESDLQLGPAQQARRGAPVGVRGSSAEWDNGGFELSDLDIKLRPLNSPSAIVLLRSEVRLIFLRFFALRE